MPHDWHDDSIKDCLQHAESFSRSAMNVLSGKPIKPDMQTALHDDIQSVYEDLLRIQHLLRHEEILPENYRPGYVKYLEGVVFVQLHQIHQLQKEVAKHAAPA